MRIAFFLGLFPAVSETFVLHQITGLIDLGHEVHIYAERAPEDGAPMHEAVKSYRLFERTTYLNRRMPLETGYWAMPIWPLTGKTWLPGAEKPISNASRALRALPVFLHCFVKSPRLALNVVSRRQYGEQAACLASLYNLRALTAERGRYDVLHAHFGPVGNNFRFARALWKTPLVVTFHGYDFCVVPRERGTDVYHELFRVADVVTVNSAYTRGRVIELGCPGERIHKLHVGLNMDQFSFRDRVRRPDEPVRILSVGRLVEIKGHEIAIRAVASARQKHPQLQYEIIGAGPLRPALEQLVRELRLENNVTLHGARDGEYVRQRMAAAHVFVMPSVSVQGDQEGQGLALQEAQACGLPVIATNHGALPEGMLPGESGFTVPERDPAALAERLTFLIEHPELWEQFGRKGRAFVEARYDIKLLNQQLASLYAELVRNYQKKKVNGLGPIHSTRVGGVA